MRGIRTAHSMQAAGLLVALCLVLVGCSPRLPVRESGTFPNITQMLGAKRSSAEKSLGDKELLDDTRVDTDVYDGPLTRFRTFSLWDLQGSDGLPPTIGLGLDKRARVDTVEFSLSPRDDMRVGFVYQQRDFPGNLLAMVGVEEFEVTDRTAEYRRDMEAYVAVWEGRGTGGSSSLTWQVVCTLRGANLEDENIFLQITRMGDAAVQSSKEEEAPAESVQGKPAEQDVDGNDEPVEGAEMGDVPTAEVLGGTSHEGETLWFVVAAAEQSEGDAWWRISDALPLFGDTQMYFIVEQSSHIEGFEPGLWVVIEAYQDKEHAESGRDWSLRAFEDAYIKQGTVKCDDPIPVVEELVEGYN